MFLDSFATLTEFSIAVAGFSGVAVAIAGRDGAVEPVVWFRNLSMLTSAVGAAFASFLPHLAASFGMSGPPLWAVCSIGLALIQAIVIATPLMAVRHLRSGERRFLATYMWIIWLVGIPSFLLWQLFNAAGLAGSASPGPIVAGIAWLLFISAFLFVRMLARPPNRPAA